MTFFVKNAQVLFLSFFLFATTANVQAQPDTTKASSKNTFSSESFTTNADSDGDGIADINDLCMYDFGNDADGCPQEVEGAE